MVIYILSYIISTYFLTRLIDSMSKRFARDSFDIYSIKTYYRKTNNFRSVFKFSFFNYSKILLGIGAIGMMSIVWTLMGGTLYFIVVFFLELFGVDSSIEFKDEPRYLFFYIIAIYFIIGCSSFIYFYTREYNDIKNEILKNDE